MTTRTPPGPERPDLDALLKASAERGLTPAEAWDQRVSWAYGQLMGCAPDVSREQVEARSIEIYGPRPDPEPSS